MSDRGSYSGFIRVRAAGILVENEKLLLVKLTSPITGEEIWMPPGGGIEFKEKMADTAAREFKEETNLDVQPGQLIHVEELIQNEFHVIEFYYNVKRESGIMALGLDPEHSAENQLLKDIGFFTREEIQTMNVKPSFLKEEFWNQES